MKPWKKALLFEPGALPARPGLAGGVDEVQIGRAEERQPQGRRQRDDVFGLDEGDAVAALWTSHPLLVMLARRALQTIS